MKSDQFKTYIEGVVTSLGGSNPLRINWVPDANPCIDMKDGVITLPSFPDGITMPPDLVKLMRGYVDHEAGGHGRETDHELVFKRIMEIKKEQGENAAIWYKNLWNLFEDSRIERKLIDHLPGTKNSLKYAVDKASNTFDCSDEQLEESCNGQNGELIQALFPLVRREPYGLDQDERLNKIISKETQELAKEIAEKVLQCDTNSDILKVTDEYFKHLDTSQDPPNDPQESGGQSDKGKDGDGEGGEEEQKVVGVGPTDIGDLIKDAMGPFIYEHVEGKEDIPPWIFNEGKSNEVLSSYLLKDYKYKKIYKDSLSGVGPKINVLKSKFRQSLLSTENRSWEAGKIYGKLDSKRFPKAIKGIPEVYKQRYETPELDTALTILIDMSGSMSGKKSFLARDVSIILNEALKGTKVSYKVVGFRTQGYQENWIEWSSTDAYYNKNIYFTSVNKSVFPIFKDWNDPAHLAQLTLPAIPYNSGAGNDDYSALDFAYKDLQKRREERKILIVISDGAPTPYTHNCYPDQGVLMKDLSSRMYREHKIETTAIGIWTDTVGHYYKNHIAVSSLNDFLSKGFQHVITTIRKGASC